MEDHQDKAKTGRRQDTCLLVAALLVGITATLSSFGVDRISWPAAAALAGAAVLAWRPAARLFWRGRILQRNRRGIIALLLGVHLIATFFFFPPEDLVNSRPVVTLDHALHFYQVERSREVFWNSFRLDAYDPYFMAGYPGGTIFDLDSKGVELWTAMLRFVDVARAFKLFVFLAHFLMLASLYCGSRRLGYSFRESVLASLLFLFFWHWGRPYAGHFRFAGMFAFIFVSHLSLYLCGLFQTFLKEQPVKRFYLLGPIAFCIHPTVGVMLPVPLLAMFLAARWRHLPGARAAWARRLLPRLLFWLSLILLGNAVWLVPFFRYLHLKTPSETYFQISGFGQLAGLLLRPGNLPALVLLLLAGSGLVSLWRQRRWSALAGPGSAGLFLFILAGYGVYLPVIDQMEPGRFLLPALMFLAPPAGAGCSVVLRRAAGLVGSRPLSRLAQQGALLLLLILLPAASLVSARAYYRHTLHTAFCPEVRELISVLQEQTDPSGRLMIEDGPAWAYGNCLLPSILPLFTSVEQIGGPYPHTFIRHHYATFQTDCVLGRPLIRTDPGRLKTCMRLYRVKWILTASQESRRYFAGLPFIRPLWSSGKFDLWEFAAARDPADGQGITVQASYDLIEVRIDPDPDNPPADKILLSYHWDPGLKVNPPARISRLKQLDDPVPLILLEPNQAREIKITYR